ncbi:MAG TPA: hypothetical protein DEP72_05500 [Clostridiales bacterium]|nr:MAG: hypothetical protein A2Y18_03085 [Clostridiales bacterium GWD2_32_19]HCC07597.1 hypothetical protein [Clostridiales bacterium]
MKKIDLHMHTSCSDGVLSPKEIIDEAVKNGVETLAIADHDTLAAYSNDFLEYAQNKNINIITAVEISTRNDKVGIHVLGYNIDIYDKKLNKKLSKLRNSRHNYLVDVAHKLNGLGYIVNLDKLSKIDTVTKAHIALDIVENPNNASLLDKEFNHIPNKGEFIETIMNENCPGYVKKESITPIEASDLIRNAGGKVILAHPVAYRFEDNLEENDVLSIVEEMKADGIESNYIYIDRNNNKIDEIEKWNTFAKDNNLIITIGSDFHNDDGIHPLIGLINEKINLNDEDVNKIINNLLKNN